jgi:hypothetical protein
MERSAIRDDLSVGERSVLIAAAPTAADCASLRIRFDSALQNDPGDAGCFIPPTTMRSDWRRRPPWVRQQRCACIDTTARRCGLLEAEPGYM